MTQPEARVHPPRLARWLIALLTPEEFEDAVLGDLEEGFDERSRGAGRLVAQLWYWRQLLNGDVWRLRAAAKRVHMREGQMGVVDVAGVEFRQAIRVLRRNPGYTAAAVCTLVVGLGATTTIFNVLNGLFLRPIPGVERPATLASVQASDFGGAFGVASYVDYLDLRERSQAFESLAAFKPRRVDASASGVPEPVEASMVTSSYFDVLGVRPAIGRFFDASVDVGAGAHPEVILTEGLWRRWFGADPSAVGRSIRLNGLSYTIVGVTPGRFRGTSLLSAPELFVPMTMQPNLMPTSGNLLESRGWGGVSIVGRLAVGSTVGAAAADVREIGEDLGVEYPRTNQNRIYTAVGFREATVPSDVRGPMVQVGLLLMGVVGAVWLVVWLNVSSLFLARSMRRRRELAIRVAVGAGRWRVVGQLVSEFMLIAFLAAIGGAIFAQLLAGGIASQPIPIIFDAGTDGRTVVFVAFMALLTGVLCSLIPALTLASRAPRDVTTPATGPRPERRRWPSRLLIMGQVTVSVVLVFSTGLLAQTLVHLTSADRGFDSSHLITARFDPALQGYDATQTADFYRRLTEEARMLPGVRAVALADGLPGATEFGSDGWFIRNADEPERSTSMSASAVSPNFFSVLGIPIIAGRGFDDRDVPGAVPALLVNEAAASIIEERTGRTAVGQALGMNGPGGPFLEVVGVVGDSRGGRTRSASPFIYGAHEQALALGLGGTQMVVMLKGARDMSDLASPLREVAAQVDPNVSASDVVTMDAFLDGLLAVERLTVTVLGTSSAVALGLAALGLYGLLAYLVTQRTREFGIRLALGAASGTLRRIIVVEALVLSATGLALGGVLVLFVTRWTEAFLVGVSPADPMTIVGSVLAVFLATLVAAYAPAARAARASPVAAMKAE